MAKEHSVPLGKCQSLDDFRERLMLHKNKMMEKNFDIQVGLRLLLPAVKPRPLTHFLSFLFNLFISLLTDICLIHSF